MASLGVVCDRVRVRRLLLLSVIGLSACDLSDLTDGKSGGGGSAGAGGNQAGGSGGGGNGTGGISTGGGGAGGMGNPTCEPGSPFEWMIAIGNDQSQAVSVTDDAPANTLPASIRVAEVPAALGGGFVAVMLTTGVLDLAAPIGVEGARSIFIVHFSAAGGVISAKAHTQSVEQELPDTARSIDDVVVHETGRVFVVGRAGKLPLSLSGVAEPIVLASDNVHDDAFLAAFDLDGNAVDAIRLVSNGTGAANDSFKGAAQARGLVSLADEIGVVGFYHRGLNIVDRTGTESPACPALPTSSSTKNGFLMLLPVGSPLGACSRGRAFAGTGDARISFTSVSASDSQLFLTADFDLRKNNNAVEQQLTLNTSPAWVLDSTDGSYLSESMVMSLEQATLTPQWVSLIETGGGVNDHAASASIGPDGTVWVAGKGVALGDTSDDLIVSRKFPTAGQICMRSINTLKSRAFIAALNAEGDCQAVVDYALESSIESSLVLNGTPWFGGFATTSAFPLDELTRFGTLGLDPNGMLMNPTVDPDTASINASGLLFGGPGRVRSYELSAVGDKILVAGIMSQGFLGLPCPSDAPAQIDFFLALYDPAQGP